MQAISIALTKNCKVDNQSCQKFLNGDTIRAKSNSTGHFVDDVRLFSSLLNSDGSDMQKLQISKVHCYIDGKKSQNSLRIQALNSSQVNSFCVSVSQSQEVQELASGPMYTIIFFCLSTHIAQRCIHIKNQFHFEPKMFKA